MSGWDQLPADRGAVAEQTRTAAVSPHASCAQHFPEDVRNGLVQVHPDVATDDGHAICQVHVHEAALVQSTATRAGDLLRTP